jgi:predicted MFS family arabinose efflux permease
MALALVPIMIALPYQALMPIFADEVLGRGASGFGIMMSAVGVGAVIGTLTIASISSIQRKGVLLITAIFLLGGCLMLFALSRNFYLSIACLVFMGALFMAYMTTNQTLIHLTVTDELRGRVMGIYMINQGMLPLGSLFAGVLADLTSAPTAVFCMGAAVSVLALIFGATSKNLRSA